MKNKDIYSAHIPFSEYDNENNRFLALYPDLFRIMGYRVLYGSYLDLDTFFENEEKRIAFIEERHLCFVETLNAVFDDNLLSEPNRNLIKKYAYDILKVSTHFYCPAYVLYDISSNVFTFGLLSDYFAISTKDVSNWGDLFQIGSVEIESRFDDMTNLSFTIDGLLSK